MSVISFFKGSVAADPLVAMADMLRRLRSLPPADSRRKSVKNALSNRRIPVRRSLRKVKPILVAGSAILTLSLPALNGQVRLRATSERAVSRGIVREARDSQNTRKLTIGGPIRALVDASKDGGVWWYPQYTGTGFDQNQNHQGKAMADAMRARGWQVTELPRGTVITPEKLQGFDVVIRPEPYLPYSTSEANAYREAVAGGVRLFLIGSAAGYDDRVADILGLRFGGNRHISVEKIVPHSLTAGIESLAIPWVTVLEMPQGSVVLAWGANDDPLLGYHSNSAGYVLFAGTSSGIFGDPLRSNTLEFLERNSVDELQRQFLPSPAAINAAGPPAPDLSSPEPGEVLPQPDAGEWLFKWKAVPGAERYQITVLGPKASLFLVNTETALTFHLLPEGSGYVVDCSAIGWRWSVRAQGSDGQWGNWSEERLFDVAYIP